MIRGAHPKSLSPDGTYNLIYFNYIFAAVWTKLVEFLIVLQMFLNSSGMKQLPHIEDRVSCQNNNIICVDKLYKRW